LDVKGKKNTVIHYLDEILAHQNVILALEEDGEGDEARGENDGDVEDEDDVDKFIRSHEEVEALREIHQRIYN